MAKKTPAQTPKKHVPPPASKQAKSSDLWKPAVFMLCILCLCFWLYQPALSHDFTNWDDAVYVTENPMLMFPNPANKQAIWKEAVSLNYHPLTMYSLSLDCRLTRPGALPPARPFIATNLYLHLFNTLLVFVLVWSLSGFWEAGVLSAALFGIHPMHVESVAWISERKDVLYGFFFLLSLIAYLPYARRGGRHWYLLGFLFFVLSCLSKAMAVSLPLVLLLLDFYEGRLWKNGKWAWSVVLEKIPFFAVSVYFGLLAVQIQSNGALADFKVFTLFQRFLFASYGFVQYLYKFFVPFPLTTFYPYPDEIKQGTVPVSYYFYLPMALGILGTALWSMRRSRLLAFSVGFYFFTVAFVLQFISVGVVIMADRYTYLPYIGVGFLASMGFSALWRRDLGRLKALQWPITALAVLFLGFLAWRTQAQVGVWKNSEVLWTNVLKYYPNATEAYKSRGNFYGKTGRLDLAMQDLQKAADLGSKDAGVFNGLGNCYGSKGLLDKALEVYTQGIAFNSDNGELYFNRGITHARKGAFAEAISDYVQALPKLPAKKYDILSARGYAYLNNKQYPEAIADFDQLVGNSTATADAYQNRGIAYFNLKNYQAALRDLEQASRLAPNDANIQKNIQVIRSLLGK